MKRPRAHNERSSTRLTIKIQRLLAEAARRFTPGFLFSSGKPLTDGSHDLRWAGLIV